MKLLPGWRDAIEFTQLLSGMQLRYFYSKLLDSFLYEVHLWRASPKQLQQLKDEVAVQRLVESAGIELNRVGKDLAGKCPFHDDREPSLIVTPTKNLWHCFGCQMSASKLTFCM